MKHLREPTFTDVTFVHKTILKYLAVVPLDGYSLKYMGTQLLVAFQIMCIAIFLICFVGYGLGRYREGIIEADYICESVLFAGVYIRLTILILRRSQFIQTMELCEELWLDMGVCEKRVIQKFVRMMHWVVYFLFSTSFAATSFYVLASQLQEPKDNNGTQHRILPARFYFDELEAPWYEIVFFFQCVLMLNSTIVSPAVDTLAPFLIMMACGFFNSLRNRIDLITKLHQDDDEHDLKLKLLSCVVFHQKVFKLCEEIQKLSSGIFMTQIVCTTYNLSLSGFKLVGDDPDRFKYTTIVLLCFLQLFACQWPADRILEESQAITMAIYFVPSVHKTPYLKKLISFVMLRSQRPVQMKAGGVVELSLSSFGSMVINAISFFTVLQNFKTDG